MSNLYDCCMFYNELDMLELRFNILDPVVDYFVVCEAEETHSGQPKPLNLLANWERFKRWHHKLIYVNAGMLSNGERNSWQRERYHRACIAEGLSGAYPMDWVVVGDCDEIANPDVLGTLKDSGMQAAKLELDFYYYDFNHRVREGWAIGAYRHWIHTDPNKIRTCADSSPTHLLNAGWHFSYFASPQGVIEKVNAFMHHGDIAAELPRDPDYIAAKMKAGEDLYDRGLPIEYVPIGDHLPRYVLDNLDQYKEWLA